MVEKIIVNPDEIRGGGNIALSKEVRSFRVSECNITGGSAVINGVTERVYSAVYASNSVIGVFLKSIGVTSVVKSVTLDGHVIKYTPLTVTDSLTMSQLNGCVKNILKVGHIVYYDTYSTSSTGMSFTEQDKQNLVGVVKELSLLEASTGDIIQVDTISQGDING